MAEKLRIAGTILEKFLFYSPPPKVSHRLNCKWCTAYIVFVHNFLYSF